MPGVSTKKSKAFFGVNTLMNLLDLLFPPRCVSCGRIGKYICPSCSLLIRIIRLNEQVCPVCEKPAIGGETHPRCKNKYSLDGLTSFFVYDGPIRKAIKLLKYRFVTDLAKELINMVGPLPLPHRQFSAVSNRSLKEDTIVAQGSLRKSSKIGEEAAALNPYVFVSVPLHWRRFNWRGFNQSEILGKLMAEKLGIKFLPDLLIRKKYTEPQVKLKSKERKENIKDAFVINSQRRQIPNTSYYILFDDVWTTGSTLRACAKVLKQAGVEKVWGMTLAR